MAAVPSIGAIFAIVPVIFPNVVLDHDPATAVAFEVAFVGRTLVTIMGVHKRVWMPVGS